FVNLQGHHVGFLGQPRLQINGNDRGPRLGSVAKRHAGLLRLERDPRVAHPPRKHFLIHARADEVFIEEAVDLFLGELFLEWPVAADAANQAEETTLEFLGLLLALWTWGHCHSAIEIWLVPPQHCPQSAGASH